MPNLKTIKYLKPVAIRIGRTLWGCVMIVTDLLGITESTFRTRYF